MASFVKDSAHTSRDYFIYAMSGTEDFAYPGFTSEIDAMADVGDGTFVLADRESQCNLAYRVREGYRHDALAAGEYTYHGLRFFWADEARTTSPAATKPATAAGATNAFGLGARVIDVVADPAWPGYGRLLFPLDRQIAPDLNLGEVSSLLPWFTHVTPHTTVAVLNDLRRRAASGEQVFHDIYTEEKRQDPSKNDTGLFLFKGDPPRHRTAGGRHRILPVGRLGRGQARRLARHQRDSSLGWDRLPTPRRRDHPIHRADGSHRPTSHPPTPASGPATRSPPPRPCGDAST